MPYKASDAIVHKICNFESFRAHPYKDSGGLWTVGFGQRCGEHDYPNGISKDDALNFVLGRLEAICKWLAENFPKLMPHQVDALCCFIYNIGIEGFKDGTVDDLIKQRSPGVSMVWRRYVHDAAGNIQAGLVDRRNFETALFVYGW